VNTLEQQGGAAGRAGCLLNRHFEDIAVGDRFETRGRTVTEADVTMFATLTGDTHPQHTDAEWSARSRFGERIAHGMLVLSFSAGLVPFDPDLVVAMRGVEDCKFKQPVRFGDTIHVVGEVRKKTELDDSYGLVGCRWRVQNQRGKLVMLANVEVVWRRAGTAATPEREERPAAEPVLI
jgi:3-hydroxybutyryl-CoA dehydratase